ncbi:MAG TPA: aromatic ring-hydroxylating dioxygenase subunit alpha [Burkholderiales bacterium]|nr:aromatic ring-hydroxylating dioxygenase subunit alpha [Burkholderiales bacterium]
MQARPAFAIDVAAVVDDRPAEGVFRVRREAFTSPEIFDLELAHIFESTWVFIGLESQVRHPHDFVTTYIGRQPVVLSRAADGSLHCFLNSCRHRGAMVCPTRAGNKKMHVCRYHGWSYDSAGRSLAVAHIKDGQYRPEFQCAEHHLEPVARLSSYRGFVFASLSADVPPLEEHLGGAARLLDLVVDQGPQGLEYVPGEVRYTFAANWKFQFENGLDFYHFATTHAGYVEVLNHRVATGQMPQPRTYEDEATPEGVGSYTFPYGHAVMYAIRKQGRVHVRPIAEDPAVREELRSRVGADAFKWMLRQRNLTIFPNLQVVDISSLQLRVWRPLAPDLTEIESHCLAPVGESARAREMRIRHYEDFFNPTGLGSSDDNVMYELCQAGYEARSAGATQGYERGMAPARPDDPYSRELKIQPDGWAYGPVTFGDETCLQAGWREWKRLLLKGLSRASR